MKRSKEKITLSILLAAVLVVGIVGYMIYVQHQFYTESTKNLLETYEQVDKTFTMFAQRNWNVLSEWGSNLQDDADGEAVRASLCLFNQQKPTWKYSGLYLFNEDCTYLDAEGGYGSAKHIWGAFSEMYTTGHPCVGSYTMKNGECRVVFTVPIEPVEVDGETYTCIAVSYDNETLEEMIGGHAYNGQSDCYIIYPSGDIMLSEEPKSEIEPRMENLFDFLEQNAQINTNALAKMREDVQNSGRGSVAYRYGGKSYYLVYQPVGFQSLSIVGIVDRSVVDAGMRKIQTATILLLIALMAGIVFTLVRFVRINARQEVEEKEHALRAEASERKKMEGLANSDGLTGLFNERYFSRVLNICEAKKLPFVLYYLDLDRFKPINDTYGHAMGDRLLKEISARLLRCIRSRDYAFRIGGDEFALIVSADMDEEQRSRMAERIQTMLSAPIVIEGKPLSVGVSCGCACYPEDGDASQVRITADSRMYAEKQHHHEDDRTEEQS